MNYKLIDLPNIDMIAAGVRQHLEDDYFTSSRFVSHLPQFFVDFTILFDSLAAIKSPSDVTNIAIISVAPHSKINVHIDDLLDGHVSAINIPISGCKDSYTCFFKIKENAAVPTTMRTATNDIYYQYADEDVEEIDRLYLHKAAVFNTRVPHNVVNDTDEARVILSVRFNTLIDISKIS